MCSSVSPSITVPRSNSIGHASLPGCRTTAWPPSWNAPSSKLVRVRIDGLKNTSAIERPFSSSPSLLRLNMAACASKASRSARLQSWVLRKCFMWSIPWLQSCAAPAHPAPAAFVHPARQNEKTQREGWVRRGAKNCAPVTQRKMRFPVGAHATSCPRPSGRRQRGAWRGMRASGRECSHAALPHARPGRLRACWPSAAG